MGLLLASAVFCLVAASSCFANAASAKTVFAADSSSASTNLLTPGSVVYLHVNSASLSSYANFSFSFKGTGSSGETLTTSFASVVSSSNSRFFSATIPAYPAGVTAWTQFRCYAYASKLTIANSASAHTDWVTNSSVNEIVIPYSGTFSSSSTAAPVETFVYGSDAQAIQYWCREKFEYSQTDYYCSQIYNGTAYTQSKIDNLFTAWENTISPSYSSLSSGAKFLFQSAVSSSAGTTDLVRSVTRYDYILVNHQNYVYTDNVSKFSNFANRTISGYSGASVVLPSSNSSSTLVLAGLAAIAVLAVGSYFFIRKKKTD